MNWIDDKYKDKLGNKKFPSSLKEAGWEKAQPLLDKEFPLAKTKAGFGASKLLFMALALLIIPASIWYFNNSAELPAAENFNTNGQNPIIENKEEFQNTENSKIEKSIPVNMNSLISNENTASSSGESKDYETSGHNEDDAKVEQDRQADKEVEKAGLIATIPEQVKTNSFSKPEINENASVENSTEDKNDDEPVENRPNEEIKPNIGDGENVDVSNDGDNQGDETNNRDKMNVPSKDTETEPKTDVPPSPPSSTQNSPNQTQTPPENQDILLPSESETPSDSDPDSESSNTGMKKSNLRKEHFAFLENELDNSISDYQLFSRERFSISLWAAYSYVDKFLLAENGDYLEKRNNEEKSIWTSASGFKIDYFLDNHWTFGFGLARAEYGEELDYNISSRDTMRIDGRNSSPAEFNNIVGLDSVRIITGINQGHWNYTVITEDGDSSVLQNNGKTNWQYLEIPFTVGYRFGAGRIKPWLKTGLSLGIPINTNFRYLNEQATNLSDVRLSNSDWVAPLQYNYLFEAGIDCFITRSFSVRANAISSFQLNSSFEQNSSIRQRYYRLGMSIGLAYNF